MLDFYNQIFEVIKNFTSWLFTLEFLPGVSYGSVILVAMLLWVISILWPRN